MRLRKLLLFKNSISHNLSFVINFIILFFSSSSVRTIVQTIHRKIFQFAVLNVLMFQHLELHSAPVHATIILQDQIFSLSDSLENLVAHGCRTFIVTARRQTAVSNSSSRCQYNTISTDKRGCTGQREVELSKDPFELANVSGANRFSLAIGVVVVCVGHAGVKLIRF